MAPAAQDGTLLKRVSAKLEHGNRAWYLQGLCHAAMQKHQVVQVPQHLLAHLASSAEGCTVPRDLGAAASCLCQSPADPTAMTPDAQVGLQPSTAVGCFPPLLQGRKQLLSSWLLVGVVAPSCSQGSYSHLGVHQVHPSPRSPRSAQQHAPALQLMLLPGWRGP